jgi:hypothetical protein
MNALADLSHEEYKQKYALGLNNYQRPLGARPSGFKYADLAEEQLPQEVDWRSNAVAEVKNQMNVGGATDACWARQLGAAAGVTPLSAGGTAGGPGMPPARPPAAAAAHALHCCHG